ncbi:hypothetical protein [Shuttleworthella sp. MSX8B]|nr:hypothetical protein [Shuttleworthia sp. MSX8B]
MKDKRVNSPSSVDSLFVRRMADDENRSGNCRRGIMTAAHEEQIHGNRPE